jgi:hypothetical protein
MGFVGCPSAWIGDDHILLIGGTRFSETYQRVYFCDLQALLIRRKRRFVMQWPYLLLVPLFAFASLRSGGASLSFGVVAAIMALIALVSTAFGCYLDLATAVGNVPVRSVAFVWTARRFAAKVVPLVTASQTGVSSETGPSTTIQTAGQGEPSL